MTRTFNTVSCFGAACALAVTIACGSGTPGSPAAPGAAVPGSQDANPDGSTLKVTAPGLASPISDVRLDNRQPTLVATLTSGLYANRPFSYEFELMDDAGNRIAGTTRPGGSSTTSWDYPEELERDTPYRWRVRATLDGRVGPWSSAGRFFTVKENRTPNPASGRIPFPTYGASVVAQVAAQRADLLFRSCQEHGGSWEFLDLVVDTLRLQDSRWGYNGKRGNPNDPSLDVVAYNWGSQPDEGTRQVYIIDVISGHCGDSPGPTFLDMTELTAQQGFTGIWISRGRFPGSSGIN